MAETNRIGVTDWSGAPSLLAPERGQALAEVVISRAMPGTRVVLDFQGVDVISTGFANGFFVGLKAVAPLDVWRSTLVMVGLSARQREAISKSLQRVTEDATDSARPLI